ncbi:MAG: thymidine kinase [Clostridia bacterium]|nr:thymidine kinase [Clostridia bacterium]
MAKLYFKYGSMGSSKTAQALITKFNYEECGMKVWLIKPAIDTRESEAVVRSRIGLESKATLISDDQNVYDMYMQKYGDCDVVIVDECQFFTEKQIDELGLIVLDFNVPVLCFGLRSDFLTHLFPGSKRLFEIAESISEIKNVCVCGRKATVNARIDPNGKIITQGEQIYIGGNDSYVAMCRKCYINKIAEQQKEK